MRTGVDGSVRQVQPGSSVSLVFAASSAAIGGALRDASTTPYGDLPDLPRQADLEIRTDEIFFEARRWTHVARVPETFPRLRDADLLAGDGQPRQAALYEAVSLLRRGRAWSRDGLWMFGRRQPVNDCGEGGESVRELPHARRRSRSEDREPPHGQVPVAPSFSVPAMLFGTG